jgi:hypothetical protein
MNKRWEKIKIRICTWLSVLSVTICVITIILWPLSYATGVQASVRNGAGTRYALITVPGAIGWAVVRGEARAWPSFDGCARHFGAAASTIANTNDKLRWFWRAPAASHAGFASDAGSGMIYFGEVNDSFACQYTAHFMPIWLLSLLAFIGPAMWYKSRQRRQYRIDNDLCIFCGTDMTASPYRCPACGKEKQW